MIELANIKKRYDKIRGALEEVQATGYGIVMPGLEELTLEAPEIVKQGGRYGVKLKASAPSIHNGGIKKKCRVCEEESDKVKGLRVHLQGAAVFDGLREKAPAGEAGALFSYLHSQRKGI
jgi:hypothetical protein